MNLQNKKLAYIFGFIQADGNIVVSHKAKSTTYKRLSIELKSIDKEILEKIKIKLKTVGKISERTRQTNFKEITTAKWQTYNQNLISQFIDCGIPVGNKSSIISVPNVEYSEIDYWRGLIDGDGSVGFRKSGKPFIGLVTSSDHVILHFKKFISKSIGKEINTSRNKRDNVYNIYIEGLAAQQLIKILYYKKCFALQRKYEIAKQIIKIKLSTYS